MRRTVAIALAALLLVGSFARTDDFAALCADRVALEHVYHGHRTGTKQPFEQAMPRALVERLVRDDMHEEAVLGKAYAVEITPAMVAAEVQRINATTRVPEMLAGIKKALGDDAGRLAARWCGPSSSSGSCAAVSTTTTRSMRRNAAKPSGPAQACWRASQSRARAIRLGECRR